VLVIVVMAVLMVVRLVAVRRPIDCHRVSLPHTVLVQMFDRTCAFGDRTGGLRSTGRP
jgi:hypothetical protein